jgi:hypothetical protein
MSHHISEIESPNIIEHYCGMLLLFLFYLIIYCAGIVRQSLQKTKKWKQPPYIVIVFLDFNETKYLMLRDFKFLEYSREEKQHFIMQDNSVRVTKIFFAEISDPCCYKRDSVREISDWKYCKRQIKHPILKEFL